MNKLLHTFFTWNVRHKNSVIFVFKIGYLFIVAALILMAYFLSRDTYVIGLYTLGVYAGQIALLLFCVTITPGILRRFSIRGSITSLLMLYRRHLGIATFAFAFYHYASIQLFPVLFNGVPFVFIPPVFEAFGLISLFAMSLLFFTSNHWSVQKLGQWWSRVHTLIYITAWGIFFHVFLQDISLWTILIGSFALFETISLLYAYIKKK